MSPARRLLRWATRDRLGQIAILLAVAAAVALILATLIDRRMVESEFPKALIQLSVVGLIGTIGAGFVSAAQEDNERRRRDYDYRLELFREITNSYNTIKDVRRVLIRAGIRIPPADSAAKAVLSQQVDRLSDAQLAFEASMRLMRVRKTAFDQEIYGKLEQSLRQMERYVNEVIDDVDGDNVDGDGERGALNAYLGSADKPGGLTAGWGRVESKLPKKDGFGPSAVMWEVESLIGRSV